VSALPAEVVRGRTYSFLSSLCSPLPISAAPPPPQFCEQVLPSNTNSTNSYEYAFLKKQKSLQEGVSAATSSAGEVSTKPSGRRSRPVRGGKRLKQKGTLHLFSILLLLVCVKESKTNR
jgi:hypothetical protein